MLLLAGKLPKEIVPHGLQSLANGAALSTQLISPLTQKYSENLIMLPFRLVLTCGLGIY